MGKGKTHEKDGPLHWLLHKPTATVIGAHVEHMLPPAPWQRHCAGCQPLDAACGLILSESKAQRLLHAGSSMFRPRIVHGLFQLEPRTLLLMAYCKIQIYISNHSPKVGFN